MGKSVENVRDFLNIALDEIAKILYYYIRWFDSNTLLEG
ncbi:hypothetical protein LOT_0005 [Lentilactobacillus otakiensis DSM 19908 = JCM 15040]|uniref:Uncharacterized protein n=1 Tax=Lentilactobacillus otakiensis DSM 19908 = JCM 15040 TaxID=1423780 RepID=S4NE72_9LACO|nr:hypothetical protein LOT_0005 [Lentilactobacillus otakiensis DSM 19908 = JCM 15040]